DLFVFNSFFVKNVAASPVGDESDLACQIVSVRPLFGGRCSCMKTKHVQAARSRILQSPTATERVSRLMFLSTLSARCAIRTENLRMTYTFLILKNQNKTHANERFRVNPDTLGGISAFLSEFFSILMPALGGFHRLCTTCKDA